MINNLSHKNPLESHSLAVIPLIFREIHCLIDRNP
jgi:hypothetical protein